MADYLKKFTIEISSVIKRFSESNNLWLERTTSIFQLKYSEKRDFELIKSLILYCNTKRAEREVRDNDKSDFFIQKAIG